MKPGFELQPARLQSHAGNLSAISLMKQDYYLLDRILLTKLKLKEVNASARVSQPGPGRARML